MSTPPVSQTFALALEHQRAGRLGKAEVLYRQVLSAEPQHADALHHLGIIAHQMGRDDLALDLIRRGVALAPHNPSMHFNLGEIRRKSGKLGEAIGHYQRALELRPDFAEAWNSLGGAFTLRQQFDEAVDAFRKALEARPDYAGACNNLAGVLARLAQVGEAAALYRRAAALKPDEPAFLSNLLLVLPLCPTVNESVIREEQLRWNRLYAEPLHSARRTHTNRPDPERRLKIGYVSPDFRSHALSFFTVPLLEAHDREVCEIHCYANVSQPDAVTERLRRSTDVWHDVRALSDANLAERIRADGIDILVDLAMHSADHRLLVFARKPASIQVSWLAYPGTTGLETIDYRLTDAHIEPAGGIEDDFGGEPVRLPDVWCCYAPIEGFPAVGPLPAKENGGITFGSLNQFGKVHEGLLRCWARLLQIVPRSRLLLICPAGHAQERTRALFAAHDIAPERVQPTPPQPWADYVSLFNRVDIALDAFPWNGMTTTCHALWMGVPTVTRMGTTPASRAGSSPLHTVGLSDWVAESEEDYLRIAAAWASNLPALAGLRRSLRARMEASPLMDAPRFARNLESAYRRMWEHWCVSEIK